MLQIMLGIRSFLTPLRLQVYGTMVILLLCTQYKSKVSIQLNHLDEPTQRYHKHDQYLLYNQIKDP